MTATNKLQDIGAVISLHGLGFLQIKLDGNQRLHVWHPDLPRRACFEHTAIHDHRFGFKSAVLRGVQENVVYHHRHVGLFDQDQTHKLWLHDGPRGPHGGRPWTFDGQAELKESYRQVIEAGDDYTMAPNVYHETVTPGITVTLMEKRELSTFPAHSTSSALFDDHKIDAEFDRFQLPESDLWTAAVEGLKGVLR